MSDRWFVGCDGHLHRLDLGLKVPFRSHYVQFHRQIKTVADLKSTLRVGKVVDGGYEVFFLTSDGAVLSYEAVLSEFRNIAASIRYYGFESHVNDGWRVVAACVTAECDGEGPVICDHTGEVIWEPEG